jgi:hypothetical protein
MDVAVRASAEDDLGDHLQHQHAADRREQLLQRGMADEVTKHDLVLRRADERHEQKAQRQDHERVDAEILRRDHAGVHAVHDQLAVREIDDPHHAEAGLNPTDRMP